MKRFLSTMLVITMMVSMLVGCSSSSNTKESGDSAKGKVYYLNFKPEVDAVWQKIAKDFTKDTGIECKVTTAASGKYEMTLESEITKSDAPTLFQINGKIGYDRWSDYCLDLTDTDFAKLLNDAGKKLAITDDEKIYGVPYAIEGFGIIYNDKIMSKYFSSPNKSKDITIKSADEIKNFDTLKKVVEDMTKLKKELGIEGVFSSTSLASGEDWRWHTHLANVPIYYEYRDENITDSPKEIKFTHDKEYKNLFDLYTKYSCTDTKKLSEKTVDASMAEFALGKTCMVQNGNWAWENISSTSGNIVDKEDVKFMPMYTGAKNEENQGLCIGTENFMCINSEANEDDRAATLKFLDWVFNTTKGKQYVINDLKFNAPFNSFKDNEQPTDPLAKEIKRYAESGTEPVTWAFATFPSEEFKSTFGGLLLKYTLGEIKWEDVKKGFVEAWKSEAANNK